MRDANTVIIDADYVCYLASAGKDDYDLSDVLEYLDDRYDEILSECKLAFNNQEIEYINFLSGGNSIRKEKYPDYKSNRKDVVKPKHLNACRLATMAFWNGIEVDGIEADDAAGMSSAHLDSDRTIIVTADKDWAQLPNIWVYDIYPKRVEHPRKEGQPYIYETLDNLGLWYKTSEESALKQLCAQIIDGDSGDGVKGLSQYKGKKRSHKKNAKEWAFRILDRIGWSHQNVLKATRKIYVDEFNKEGFELHKKVVYLVYIEREFIEQFKEIPKGKVYEKDN